MGSGLTYQHALDLVAKIESVQGPLPEAGPWRLPTKAGERVLKDGVPRQLRHSRGVLIRAWLQVRAGRAFPRLKAEDISQQQALRIVRLVKDLPEAARTAEVERLARLPLSEIKSLCLSRPKPPPVRVRTRKPPSIRLTGQRWQEVMGEIRQHVLKLQHSGQIENLARTWSPSVRHGYREELRQVIATLHDFEACFERAGDGGPLPRVVRLEELIRPRPRRRKTET